MDHPLLSRTRRPNRPAQTVLPGLMTLDRGRVHEICGTARRRLAVQVAARTEGPVIWIAPGWLPERLNGAGLCPLMDPGRLIFAHPRRAEDLLWCAEEALRAGAVPLVVCELPQPPALTPVRRLHLAAETGGAEGKVLPLGLLLSPGDGGAQGVESRWRLTPAHGPVTTCAPPQERWRLHRLRARTAPPAAWTLGAAPSRDGRSHLHPLPEGAALHPDPKIPGEHA